MLPFPDSDTSQVLVITIGCQGTLEHEQVLTSVVAQTRPEITRHFVEISNSLNEATGRYERKPVILTTDARSIQGMERGVPQRRMHRHAA